MVKSRKQNKKRLNKNSIKKREKIKVGKKKHAEQEELLEQIYSIQINDEFDTGDLSKFYHRKKSVIKKVIFYLFLLVLMIVISSLAGFFYFNRTKQFDGDKVLLSMQIDGNARAGELLDYEITYNNLEFVSLNDLRVTVQFPNNFVLVTSEPETVNEAKNTWEISDLAAKTKGSIHISGYFNFDDVAVENTYEKFLVNLYYTPENFSSLFKDSLSKEVNVLKPQVLVNIEGESDVSLKKETQYMIFYENTEDVDLKSLKLKANLPSNFVLTDSQPAVTEKVEFDTFTEFYWDIDELLQDTKQYVLLTGYFQDSVLSNDDLLIYAELFTENNGDKTILTASNFPLAMESSSLLVNLQVNDAVNVQHLDNKKTLTYTLSYKNTSEESLKKLAIDLYIDDFVSKDPLIHILNWNTADDKYDGSVKRTENGAKVNWDDYNLASFASLDPGAEGSITFTIDKYKNSKFAGIDDWRDFNIANYIILSYDLEDSDLRKEIKSNVVNLDFESLLNLDLTESEELGDSADGGGLYKLIYSIDTANSEDWYNLAFRFNLAEGMDWVDLKGADTDLLYTEFLDEHNNDIVVKFDDLSACDDSCTFSLVIESADKDCDGNYQSCLFNNVAGAVWTNNEIIRYND